MSYPADWRLYFDRQDRLVINQNSFNYYEATFPPKSEANNDLVLFLLHGAGYTALTWSLFVQEFKLHAQSATLVAFDMRGHGLTVCSEPNRLHIDQLVMDAEQFINAYFETWPAHRDKKIILVGHSLGGAIFTWLAGRMNEENLFSLIVIDVVEETALKALEFMPQVLRQRPQSFPSTDAIIEWGIESGSCKSRRAAAISTVSQYRLNQQTCQYEPIIDLAGSQEFWTGWFTGLSNAFLDTSLGRVPRVLVLAERDYLDRPLMIGQMQGKFQLAIVRDSGHAVQEDQPRILGDLVYTFIQRHLEIQMVNEQYQRRIAESIERPAK